MGSSRRDGYGSEGKERTKGEVRVGGHNQVLRATENL